MNHITLVSMTTDASIPRDMMPNSNAGNDT
jgi:hypothetical protein